MNKSAWNKLQSAIHSLSKKNTSKLYGATFQLSTTEERVHSNFAKISGVQASCLRHIPRQARRLSYELITMGCSLEKLNSLQGTLRLQRSVIPVVIAWILMCGEYVSLVSLRYAVKPPTLFPFCTTRLLNVEDSIPFASCTRAFVDNLPIARMKQ